MLGKKYVVITNEDQFTEAVEHLKASELVAYDTETTGLNVRKNEVIGFSFSGSEGVGYYLPLKFWSDNTLKNFWTDDYDNCNVLLEILSTKKLIMHNASFDVRITKNSLGYDLLNALHCDTILLKHAVDEERPFGLKDIAKKIQTQIGLDVDKSANAEQVDMIKSIKDNGGSVTKDSYELYKADMMKIGIYACADTDLTLRVFNYYSKLVTNEGLDKFFYIEETMPLLKHVTIPMEEGGVPLDLEAIKEAKKDIEKDINKLEDSIQAGIQPLLGKFTSWYMNYKFPPKRSGEFAQGLAKLKHLDLPLTNSGRFSVSQSNLERLEPSPYRDYLMGGSFLKDEEVREVQEWMFANTDEKYMFMLSSKHHLKKLFFETLNETPISKTKKGNPQVDALFLSTIKDKYDWMPLLMDYNKLCKIRDSYLTRFLDKEEDGVFYPSFNQHRTISGRYGSDLQQLPRPLEAGQASEVVRKYTNMIRKFCISGDGFSFIDSDYESLEPHTFAHVSGDDGLKGIFLKGHDFYSTIAIDTEKLNEVPYYKLPDDLKKSLKNAYKEGTSKEQMKILADKAHKAYLGRIWTSKRQNAKAYALGIPYGMEPFLLSKNLEIDQKEAEILIKEYLNAYPKLAQWMKDSNEQCTKYGFVKSEAGRVRHMPSAPKIWYSYGEKLLNALELWKQYHETPKKYEQMKYLRKQMRNYLNNAKNFQIQSLAASITNRACIAIARELKRQGSKGYICAQIHDQIIVRVPEEEAEKWKKTVQFLMETSYKLSIPLKAPAAVSKDFYEGH